MSLVADLSRIRADFVAWLQDAGVSGERIDDLAVVVSELAANAIRETPTDASSAEMSAHIEADVLEVTVSNEVVDATQAHVEADWDLTDPLRTGGRGLLLVSALVDDVSVEVIEHRLVLRCTATL